MRLDAVLVARGLARSRAQAVALITAGNVRVDGETVHKPAVSVDDRADLQIAGADHYVSRAAHKLIAGLDAFKLDVAGRVALDAGASTGGFSQVLLERGARPVLAVDVGHDQLASSVLSSDGLIAVEGCNIRYLTVEKLAAVSGETARPDIVTADLSFISLRTVLPALRQVATENADFVLLVKPQFEVGRSGLNNSGIVVEPRQREKAVLDVLDSAFGVGLTTVGLIRSPMTGARGNVEYLAHVTALPGAKALNRQVIVDTVRG